ncbi:hypothetical protein AV521_13170 [Streptomyces sp. IMTB 2501]|uniref:hypothetical protein n=1 Tax=Streptomyces sp. IMTB 2501 TaxID=1776340 RepID=UPI00096F642F|nr:hypothetical protein [Streptomyces sp. IMTB 2501]OLZ70944.1 hypothetical protein AV521_13170 [Streptomyces sp. IMTB 2501]
MADEQGKWLNRETAERLLRGESLEAVDASACDQAERLSQVLGALSAEAAPATGELPGEQAALAAFRKAREAADAERTLAVRAAGTSALPRPGGDAGLVRIGAPARTGIQDRRPRWARPVRLALAAALAVGTLGGVAMAAGTGMLPTPFGPAHPHPAVSVSAGGPSAGPPASDSPQGTTSPTPGPGTPSGSAGTRGGASGQASGPDGRPSGSASPGAGDLSGTPGSWWKDAAASCRDIQGGKSLDTGRRRALENLAGGSARVSGFCKVVLTAVGSADGQGNGGQGDGNGDSGGNGKGKDKGGKGDGNGQGGDGGGQFGEGNGKGNSGGGGKGSHGDGAAPLPSALAPVPPALAPAHPARTTGAGPVPAPSPTYTAL